MLRRSAKRCLRVRKWRGGGRLHLGNGIRRSRRKRLSRPRPFFLLPPLQTQTAGLRQIRHPGKCPFVQGEALSFTTRGVPGPNLHSLRPVHLYRSSLVSRRRTLFSRKPSSNFVPSVLGFFYDGAADLLSTSRREEHSERNTKAGSRSKTDRITHGVVLWPKNRLPRAISEDFSLIFYLLPNWCRRSVRLLQEIQSGFERSCKKFVQVHMCLQIKPATKPSDISAMLMSGLLAV